MPKNAVSYTELTHQVVQHAPEPLLFEEIGERVAALAPITTKNPRQTIRNAITSSSLIVATGDKRYGWKPRVINGSVLRLTLTAGDLQGKQLRYTHEVLLGDLNLKPKRKLLYLFDYGDDHEFDVEVLAINDRSAVGTYPKIVGRKGRAPRQYAQW